jgi:hypothetical protein
MPTEAAGWRPTAIRDALSKDDAARFGIGTGTVQRTRAWDQVRCTPEAGGRRAAAMGQQPT